ncbi:hypothetical protein AWJ20_2780 [Sugiyamaella lignohabitans]|uniref:MD-2-related lipid-recognition domain-containing protein n=1 Tax=Sugiyamaella lignohabitans TaxID=796027 RepID=A0A167FDE5_9ASCO|nr:uncharacterized protein AWJ20_2780 [Sugiyamaella lignohabitans]ANB15156.1 hypothetical protein AWJ20_2780 [Sugiyamaella lignohabitans]
MRNSLKALLLVLLLGDVSAKKSSKTSNKAPAITSVPINTDISNILDQVFKNMKYQAPKDCKPLPGGSIVNVCNNGTDPLLKIKEFTIDPYPLVPGHVTFNMIYELEKEIPQGTYLRITSFSEDGPIFDGQVDFCQYATFAEIKCPVPASNEPLHMKQVLEVPDDVPRGVYSFFFTAWSPDNELFTGIAANMQIDNKKLFIPSVHGDDL